MYKASNGQPENHLLLLLSAKDLESESISTKRVERLHMQGNGKHVGVIFLLQERNDNDTRRGTIAFMNLQIRYNTWSQLSGSRIHWLFSSQYSRSQCNAHHTSSRHWRSARDSDEATVQHLSLSYPSAYSAPYYDAVTILLNGVSIPWET